MHPQNVMESAVREELAAHRRNGVAASPACWCALCTADMQALALSSLPPRYVTRREGATIDAVRADAVREEVARAIHRVSNSPKHSSGTNGVPDNEVGLVNVTFAVGFSMIEERARACEGACTCWECRCDAVAFALNRFPAQYGVAVGGHSSFPENNRRQMADELSSFIDLGVRIATAHPRHAANC